ncbi:MAG: thiolase family protein [Syntrophomonadaceae bacterium]|jgi:acetyl-CoA C-acetyltransferase|nr:thiolase family protein [Syntrophomonadaceae bacterium]
MQTREVVIVSSARTAVGDFLGSLESFNPVELGEIVFNAALAKAGIKGEMVESLLAGHVGQAASPGNSARLISLACGMPFDSAAVTIHQQCPSSLRAAEICAQEIMLGKVDIGATVGIESQTNTPYILQRARKGYRLGDGEVIQDGLMLGGLICPWNGYHMGVTAENIAEMYGITREEQDEYAVRSHKNACKAINDGLFKNEIVPVEIKSRKGIRIFDTDEHPREDASLELFATLKPVFKKDGTVTAANASSLNDAAAAVIMMSADKARELDIKPLARVVSSATGGVDPKIMGMGVVPAVRRALKFAGLQQNEIDYWEINEAFAAQFLGVNRELKIDLDIINGVGSGISIGHPVGATGARLLVTGINELKRRGGRYLCASLCASGGPGVAFIVENIQ